MRAKSASFHVSLALILAGGVLAKPVRIRRQEQINPTKYLRQFGYLPSNDELSEDLTDVKAANEIAMDEHSEEFRLAVVEFQRFAGLNTTGKVDVATAEAMAMPRCGIRDKGADRAKRFVAESSVWPKRDLTYFIHKYPDEDLLPSEVDTVLKRAFSVWSSVTPLSFRSSAGDSDIQVGFFRGVHSTNDVPFDGPGGVLAHAFFPRFGGNMHFDADENWQAETLDARFRSSGRQLLQTAVHELGHSLGLQHSDRKESIMAPFYKGWMDEVALGDDDIRGIQYLYGVRKGVSQPPKITTPPPPPENDICSSPTINAATQTRDGSFYIFRGDSYWKLKPSAIGVEEGYPKNNVDWGGLPGAVDAAFFNPHNGFTYLFQGNQIGRYTNEELEPGYPRPISEEFQGLDVSNLDAALLWPRNKHLYLFKEELYWKLDVDKMRVADSYPKRISEHWLGVPDGLDAALAWSNGKTYFFKGTEYYRFDDTTLTVDADPRLPFPRPIAKWWLGCEDFVANGQVEGGEDLEQTNREPRWQWSDR
jgi:matrix metalloproteinase-14 (membrane-inserted)